MVSRLYLANDAAQYAPATVRGTWNSTIGALAAQHLGRRRRGSGSAQTVAETSTTNPYERLLGRWVSDPLTAQTISGTLDYCLLMRETDAAMNATAKLHIYVTQGDSDTPRGTLLANAVDVQEFAVHASQYAGISVSGLSLSSLAVSAGDRIVVEVGYSAANAVATSYTAGVKYGGMASDADGSSSGVSGTGTVASWVEFSGDLTFGNTYLYEANDAAPVTPGATRGTWDATGASADAALGVAPSGAKTGGTALTETSASTQDMLGFRFVSLPLAAQTIGAVAAQFVFGQSEPTTDTDSFPKLHFYVMAPDGSVRGTLLGNQVASAETPTSGQYRAETFTLSSVAVSSGDRLVLEAGARHTNALTAAKSTTIYAGGPNGEGETSGGLISGADSSAWIRIEQALVWQTAAVAEPEPQVAGTGGVVTMSTRLWRATKNNELVEEITGLFLDGAVEMNLDRSVRMSATLKLRRTDGLTPYVDYLAPFVRLTYDDGTPAQDQQVGLFAIAMPDGTRTRERREGTIEGRDLTGIVADAAFADAYNVAASTNYVTAAIAILAGIGLSRVNIPPASATTAEALSFPAGSSRLEAVNRLLRAIGYYDLYADRTGVLTSQPSRALRVVDPVATWTPDDLLQPVEIKPVTTTVANVVIVVKDNPNAAPLTAVRRNDDPASPLSTVALGREVTRLASDAQLADQAAVDALADRLFDEAGSFYQVLLATVRPTLGLGLHETVDLVLTGELASLSGRYWVRTWRLGLTPATAAVACELNRVITYSAEVAA